jgi:hypothetical protein
MPDVDDHHVLAVDAVINTIRIRSDPKREDTAAIGLVPFVRRISEFGDSLFDEPDNAPRRLRIARVEVCKNPLALPKARAV